MVTEVQPLGSALLRREIAFLFYVIPFGIGKRAFGARLGGTTLPPGPGCLRCITAPIPSRAASEHFWDRGAGAGVKAPSWPWAEAGSSGRFRLGGRKGSGPGECRLPSCSSIIFQALPTHLPFPISKGKMESNCASDADSPSHNISYTSFSDKPPFKMMYGATYLYSVPPSEGC